MGCSQAGKGENQAVVGIRVHIGDFNKEFATEDVELLGRKKYLQDVYLMRSSLIHPSLDFTLTRTSPGIF